jgi:hypothetical protein
MYANSFIVESRIGDLDPRTLNRRVYMLRKGETAEALVDLSALYKLYPGSFLVRYFLSTLPCEVYARPNSSLTSSNNLAGLFLVEGRIRQLGSQNILTTGPVYFSIPGEGEDPK